MNNSLQGRLLAIVFPLICAFAGGCGDHTPPAPEADIKRALAIYVCETTAGGTSSTVVEVLKPAITGPTLKVGDTLQEDPSNLEFIAEHKRRVVMFRPAEPHTSGVYSGERSDKPLFDEKIAYYDRMPLADFRALCVRVNASP